MWRWFIATSEQILESRSSITFSASRVARCMLLRLTPPRWGSCWMRTASHEHLYGYQKLYPKPSPVLLSGHLSGFGSNKVILTSVQTQNSRFNSSTHERSWLYTICGRFLKRFCRSSSRPMKIWTSSLRCTTKCSKASFTTGCTFLNCAQDRTALNLYVENLTTQLAIHGEP